MMNSTNISQAKEYYLHGISQNNPRIIEDIYIKFAPKIQHLIVKMGGTTEDAKDVFQDALLIIFDKTKTPNFQLSVQFYTYLYSVCRIVFLKKINKNNRRKFINETFKLSSEIYDLDEAIFKLEKNKIYKDAWGKLSTKCQEVLELYYDGKSMNEIARTLGYKTSAYTRIVKLRCKDKLEALIKKDPKYNELRHVSKKDQLNKKLEKNKLKPIRMKKGSR